METNPVYNPTPVLTPDEQVHKKDAVTAMVCGIIGLVLSWYGVVAIAGLVLSIIGFVRAKNRAFAQEKGIKENGMNNAGYICGLIGLIISIVSVVVAVLAIVFFSVVGVTMLTAVLPEVVDSIPEIMDAVPGIVDSVQGAGFISGLLLF